MVRIALLSLIAAAGLLANTADAAPVVSCGNGTLGIRVTSVDPGLTSGLCFAQNGNFNGDNFNHVPGLSGWVLLDKDTRSSFPTGDPSEGALWWTLDTGSVTAGTWSFAMSQWFTYEKLFLAFHFGGGGNTSLDNPDSFVVELAPVDFTGRWWLGPANAQMTGLSNIYLIGIPCAPGSRTCTDRDVPEPGTLGLLGLGLAGLGFGLRRRRKT